MNNKITKGALSLCLAFAAVAGMTGCTRVTDREYAIKTTMGQVSKVYSKGEGMAFYCPGFQSIHHYPLYMQTLKVAASDANFRTSDNQAIVGGYDVQFELDPTIGDPKEPFTKFNDNITLMVQQQAKSIAVAVLGQESSVNLTGKIEDIQNRIKDKLQQTLMEQKVPVRIVSVLSDGIGLSPESNQKLEQVMLEQQRSKTLELRLKNAQKAQEVATAEANVTVNALKTLRESGLSEEGALRAYFIQESVKEGHVNTPFSPGPFGAGNGGRVSVTAPAPK